MADKITLDQLAGMIQTQFDEVGKQFDEVNKKFTEVNSHLGKVESNMLTKDYLDDKLADLRGDLVVLTRKEDNKVKKLINILRKRDLISDDEVKEIMSMEPFAQLFV
ncbi:MAG: hypothetical protein HYV53_00030 [Parcubacteria group bacterium]|nr:hypothetical protein [Parcubacteria group bacterium]